MATIYVGPSSAGAADGTSWANRYGSLTAAEDRPVAANDTVLVGPGVYRETLTVDVSGTSGQPITYIADVTGASTDGVGGIVRVTGSDNDQTATRSSCITATTKNYRTFRGFQFDNTTSIQVTLTAPQNWIIEDCVFQPTMGTAYIQIIGESQLAVTVRRCFMLGGNGRGINITHTATLSDIGHSIENCLFVGLVGRAFSVDRVGGITIKNSTFFSNANAVRVGVSLSGGQTVTVNNCIFTGSASIALQASVLGEIIEDYNTLFSNAIDRSLVDTGGSSVTYPAIFNPPILFGGARFPSNPFELSNWSQVKAMGAVSLPTDDYFGTFRPTSGSKGSWGAIQYVGQVRETTTTRSSSVASIKIPDWGGHQIWVPTTNTSTIISVYVYREADYSGTLPRMVIKQPGQSDRTTTDTGSAATWNQLTDTFTPSANTDYVVVELQSLNTATSGNYDVFFDDLTVS